MNENPQISQIEDKNLRNLCNLRIIFRRRIMIIAVFSAKPYDRNYLNAANYPFGNIFF